MPTNKIVYVPRWEEVEVDEAPDEQFPLDHIEAIGFISPKQVLLSVTNNSPTLLARMSISWSNLFSSGAKEDEKKMRVRSATLA